MHGDLDAARFEFGIVVSRFNEELTGQLLKSAVDCLCEHGMDSKDIAIVWVPGAYEVPQAIPNLLSVVQVDAVIALGCVIQGETPHADLINNSVARALMSIACDHGIPVINEVVGTYNLEQAKARCSYGKESRGWYAAAAAIEMAAAIERMNTGPGATEGT